MIGVTGSCPYCLGDISSRALACRHCARDVSLVRKHEAQIELLTRENHSLKDHIASLEKLTGKNLDELVPHAQTQVTTGPAPAAWPLWAFGVLTIATLGLLHWVLFFVYDTPVFVFRIVTFSIPILFGLLAGLRGRSFWLHEWFVAFATGVTAVSLMLGVTHSIDGVPMWPQDLRDWRETIEYSLSISLAYLTGLLASGAYERWRRIKQRGSALFMLQRDEYGRLKLEQLTSDVQHLVATVAPVVSGATAVYSAVKSVLGS